MQQQLPPGTPPAASGAIETGESALDLVALARTLWNGKLLILAAGLAVGSLSYVRSAMTGVPLYTATTQMALVISEPATMDLEAFVTGYGGDEASKNTEMAVITSGVLVGRLVEEERLDEDPEFNVLLRPVETPGLLAGALAAARAFVSSLVPRPAPLGPAGEAGAADALAAEERRAVVEAVQSAFATATDYDTYVFTISATTRDADKSARLANALAELYRDDQIRQKVETTERMATWLSERVGELRADLDAQAAVVADRRAAASLVSEEGLAALNAQAVELRARLSELEGAAERAAERVAALEAAEGADAATRAAAADDGQLEALAQAAAGGDAGAQARFERRYDQLLLQARAELDRAREQAAELERRSADLAGQFEEQSAALEDLRRLEQEAQATQALYDTFLARLKEASVQGSAYEADSRILTLAGPGAKVAPRNGRAALSGLLAGLALGVALVLAREALQRGVRSAEDLERLAGAPVLGQVPRIPARGRAATIRYLAARPASAAAEAVRNLRTSLLLARGSVPPRVVVLTSAVPGEGKTTVSIALAQNLSGLGRRVLLIEGDVRRRVFGDYFGETEAEEGLAAVLAGTRTLAEAARPAGGATDARGLAAGQGSLDILTASHTEASAADVLSGEGFAALMEEGRMLYDHVVVDTPPVLAVPDARIVAQHADAVVFVVRWDHTSREQVTEGLRQLRSVGAPLAGLVLSRIDPRGMRRYGYAGRYGAYSAYGRKYYRG